MSWSTKPSSRLMRVSERPLKSSVGSSSSWLLHSKPRRRQEVQEELEADLNSHLFFECLHSQQLNVPFRILRRLGSGPPEGLRSEWTDRDKDDISNVGMVVSYPWVRLEGTKMAAYRCKHVLPGERS